MSLVDEIIAAAKSAVGTPYVWGGESSKGYDCSGLLQYAFGTVGINLPRVSAAQAAAGQAVSAGQMQPGDILWWNYSSRNDEINSTGADHVAIYIGNGQMIEALHPGEPVHIVSVRAPDGVTRIGGLGSYSGSDSGLNGAAVGPVDSLANRLAVISRVITGVPNGQQPTESGSLTPFQRQEIAVQTQPTPAAAPDTSGPRPDALVGPR